MLYILIISQAVDLDFPYLVKLLKVLISYNIILYYNIC